ncbi:SGNH/GDSL hydrolase family protein [Chitinophagaceae bacterium LWZ2-11]
MKAIMNKKNLGIHFLVCYNMQNTGYANWRNISCFFLLTAIWPISYACSRNVADNTTVITPTPTADTTIKKDSTKNYSFLALGDSYTIGQSVSDQERFPAQTVAGLSAHGYTNTSLHYIATTGWTTANLIAAINAQQPLGTYNMVTLLIGVNDQYQGVDTGSYAVRFTQLLQTSIQLAGNKSNRVFVLSIPDYSVTPFARSSDTARIRLQLAQFNAINKRITASYNVSYTDITPSSRDALNDPSLIAPDGLHPSGKMYGSWVSLLLPSVLKQW